MAPLEMPYHLGAGGPARDQNFLTGIAAHADGIHTKPESRLDNSYIHREESDLAIRLAGGAV